VGVFATSDLFFSDVGARALSKLIAGITIVVAIARATLENLLTFTAISQISEGAIDGLLHLGAIAVVFTAVYLGVDDPDKIQRYISKAAEVNEELEAVISRFRELVMRFGPREEDIDRLASIIDHRIRILSYLAYRTLPRNPFRALYVLLTVEWRAPLIWYYRKDMNMRVISTLCAGSTLLFFLLVAAKVWAIRWIDAPLIIVIAYFVFVVTISWCFIAMVAAYRLSELDGYVRRTQESIDRRIKDLVETMMRP